MSGDEYKTLAAKFNPDRFESEVWGKAAKDAGAKFMFITVKDRDGFCMFDSRVTDFDVMDTAAYARDPLKPLTDACRKNGIKPYFAYSLTDRRHPGQAAPPASSESAGHEGKEAWKSYIRYYQDQVRELCTSYGEIGGIWFDGGGDRPAADWDLEETYRIVQELQPGALVGSDHPGAGAPGEDLRIVEQGAGDRHSRIAGDVRIEEEAVSLNDSRSHNESDKNYKPPERLVHTLVDAVSRGAILVVHIGPKADGSFPTEAVERLTAVGKWLGKNGEAVYGTRPGPISTQAWGVSTRKGELVFLHVLQPSEKLTFGLPNDYDFSAAELLGGRKANGFGYSVSRVTGMIDGKPIKESTATIHLPEAARTPPDTVVAAQARPDRPPMTRKRRKRRPRARSRRKTRHPRRLGETAIGERGA